jgi:hypothetical protein
LTNKIIEYNSKKPLVYLRGLKFTYFSMKIFVKTYLYKLSDFIPHLIEHCVTKKQKIDNKTYFDYIDNTKLTTFLDYTVFEIPDYFDLEKFIKKITEKLDKAILKIETKIIKEEL